MAGLDAYSDQEFYKQLQEIVQLLVMNACIVPVNDPQAILLGGQSGSGKTMLHCIYRDAFEHNVIVINGDDYRARHPRFEQISERYGVESPTYTAAWAGRMVEAVIDALSIMRYNLVIEGTLRTSAAPLKTAELLRSRGYDVSLALMAVKPEISLVSCQLRYEQMRIAGTEPRAVDPAHHRLIVEGIVDNLRALENSGMFATVSLYARNEQRLFFSGDSEGAGRASEALEKILFGTWTEEERKHLAYLERRLGAARAIG